MRIAVIDDERPARSELKHQLMEFLPEAVVEEGESGAQALEMAGEDKFDIFFLDINLGDINGTVLVNALRNMQPEAKIVFVTAYSEYAVKAFELGVEDYIMKPYDRRRIEKMLKKCGAIGSLYSVAVGTASIDGMTGAASAEQAEDTVRNVSGYLQRNEARSKLKKIAINTAGRTIFVETEKIIFIETYNRGCLIHTEKEEYFEGKSIGDFEKKLGDMGFFRCQKSYLVNLEKIKEMFLWKNNSFAIKMEGYENHILPVGREKIKTLRRLLGTG